MSDTPDASGTPEPGKLTPQQRENVTLVAALLIGLAFILALVLGVWWIISSADPRPSLSPRDRQLRDEYREWQRDKRRQERWEREVDEARRYVLERDKGR